MPDPNLKITQQQAEAGRLVILFELDVTDLGGPIFRFTSTARESSAIVFDGETYVPINVEATGFETSSSDALPTPVLRISNVEFTVQSLIYGFNDLLNAKLIRIRTFERFLDSGADPDPTARFPDDVYFVNRKTQHNKILVEWELKSSLDQTGNFLPGRQILRDSCSQIYRVWTGSSFDYTNATCPYTGANSYDPGNNPVTDAEDRCGKRLSSCRIRFGENAVLPFAGFPGVMKISA
jgi:lambda family phage minor tail protein L